MIPGRSGDKMLDHPDFAPILDEAGALGVPIYIHPQIAHKAVRVRTKCIGLSIQYK